MKTEMKVKTIEVSADNVEAVSKTVAEVTELMSQLMDLRNQMENIDGKKAVLGLYISYKAGKISEEDFDLQMMGVALETITETAAITKQMKETAEKLETLNEFLTDSQSKEVQ